MQSQMLTNTILNVEREEKILNTHVCLRNIASPEYTHQSIRMLSVQINPSLLCEYLLHDAQKVIGNTMV